MRAYFFGNMYLSQIQQGIQAAHAVTRMFTKYAKHPTSMQHAVLMDWASYHETMILLNGGNHESLNHIYNELVPISDMLGLPISIFNEDDQSLRGACTSVGIVVPASIYDAPLDEFDIPMFNTADGNKEIRKDLYYLTKSKRLA